MDAEPESPSIPKDVVTTSDNAIQSDPLAALPHGKRNEVSPQMEDMEKMFRKFYMAHSTSAWERSKRKLIRSLSCHTFIGAIVLGVTMYILDHIWWLLLMNGKVLYTFPTNFSTPGGPPVIEVKAPFLSEVQYGVEAVTLYSCGVAILAIDGLYAFYTLKAPYGSRVIRFVTASLVFLMSGFVMFVGPIMGIMARNSESETKLLDEDPNYAYEQAIKGSINYFQDRQCNGIDYVVLGHNKTEADEMKAFCSLLSRLVCIYYFMCGTVIVPLLSFIVCWLQIIINRKVWSSKTIRRPKQRTKEQKQADMCLHD